MGVGVNPPGNTYFPLASITSSALRDPFFEVTPTITPLSMSIEASSTQSGRTTFPLSILKSTILKVKWCLSI